MKLTSQEIAHLLAALRISDRKPWKIAASEPLSTLGFAPLDGEQVDEMCQYLNCEDSPIEDLNVHQIAHIRAALEASTYEDMSSMIHFEGEKFGPLDDEEVYDLSARILALTTKATTDRTDLGEITRSVSS